MANSKVQLGIAVAMSVLGISAPIAYSQEKGASSGVQVHLVITNEAVRGDSEVPVLQSGM